MFTRNNLVQRVVHRLQPLQLLNLPHNGRLIDIDLCLVFAFAQRGKNMQQTEPRRQPYERSDENPRPRRATRWRWLDQRWKRLKERFARIAHGHCQFDALSDGAVRTLLTVKRNPYG